MISAVVCIIFPQVSQLFQQISPHYHGFHQFVSLNIAFIFALAVISFYFLFGQNSKDSSLFNNSLRGLDLTGYPLGMVLRQLFS